MISGLCHLGNPRLDEMVRAFVNLRSWFDFQPALLG
jgi:hypothetical protein